jgi:hypothetical protein
MTGITEQPTPGRPDVKERVLRAVLHTRVGRRVRREFMAAKNVVRGLEIFDRPAWLYRSHGAIPAVEVHYRAPRPVTEADVALCRRLIDAFWGAGAQALPPAGMWSHDIFRDRQREVVQALEQRDAKLLAERLAAMLLSDAVQGMAWGSVGVATIARRTTRFSSIAALNKLVALAESQGAIETECPEQGAVGLAFAGGVDALVRKTETALGLPIDFPDVGAAYGICVAGRLITVDTPDQLYAAARIRDAMNFYCGESEGSISVVEIGGGYGGMAHWLLRMTDVTYTIIDLPVINVLQGYFLAQALGHESVSFHGESPRRVAILPTRALADVELPFDVLVNKDSMPEIPHDALIDYLSWARDGCSGIFYSYNQEARAPYAGTPQSVVPQVLAGVGGFELMRRDASWLRRGYVEEIYKRSHGESPAVDVERAVDREREHAVGVGRAV